MKKIITSLIFILFSVNAFAEDIIYQTDLTGVWFLYFESQLIGPFGKLDENRLFWHDQKTGFEITFVDDVNAIFKLNGPKDYRKCLYTFNKNRNGLGYVIIIKDSTQIYYLHIIKRDGIFTAVFYCQYDNDSFVIATGIIKKVKEKP